MDLTQELSLEDLLLRSEKRKKVIFLLMEGPKNIGDIANVLAAPPTSILPQIKKLKDSHLVLQKGKYYSLSCIGKIMAEKMVPLLGTLQVLEKNYDYWTDRALEGIPAFLLRRLGELGDYRVIEPDLGRIFEPHAEFKENLLNSREVLHFSSYFQPSLIPVYSEYLKINRKVVFVISNIFFERMLADYSEVYETFLDSDNSSLFVYPQAPRILSFTVTERFMSMLLFDKKGKLDQKFLISFEESAIEWGKELFAYYLNLSEEVSGARVLADESGP
ncbi:MAG: winged helix-turn-helix domain-containing protein [Methanosarcinaceae archaeon]|nr:winged helix-turn-helix domain-containing protein [Methanosarcinaceae archaeon]MDD4496684.1 winged helix-turn-helix domain-containing protein [Methanosarcinaceae archaeon]